MTQSRLAAIYRAAAHRAWLTNRARAAELSTILDSWRGAGEPAPESRRRAGEVAHRLRGSAGTFGHDDASEAAAELEELVAGPVGSIPGERFTILLRRIDAALAQEPSLDI